MKRMNKNTYYISVGSKEISKLKEASPYEFEIEATDDEIEQLRDLFNQANTSDWKSFFRAHAPYIQYHFDRENDQYDENIYHAYELIYKLGDEETKRHIERMGILS